MKLRTLIIDDEFNGRENLEMMIKEYTPDLEIVATADSGETALKRFEEFEPEVIFLDIKMPGMNGFEFLENLPHRNFHLVFTTAHDDYGIKAIKENALDYLEKPISIDDLESCGQKILERQKSEGQVDLSIKLERLLTQDGPGVDNSKISVPTKDGYAILQSKDIVHLEANESYTMIYLENGDKHISSKNIRVYEEKLSGSTFFRTHKSHIINYHHHLKGYERREGNVAVLTNNIRVPIARRKMSTFLEIVMK
ncbi:MAG: two-component system LytT family response regulator [Patiriisocius sp.]|jgi:two-component system LytT family response regulator